MYALNRFQRWMLRRIVQRLVANRQIEPLFRLIYTDAYQMYYEDNLVTVQSLLRELLETSFDK